MTDQSKENSAIDPISFQLERWIEHAERTSSIREVAKYAEEQRVRAEVAERELEAQRIRADKAEQLINKLDKAVDEDDELDEWDYFAILIRKEITAYRKS